MDLDRRLDPEIAAALAELPILDLSDIPAARETMLARRAAAAADAQPSPTVVRQDHLVPGLNGAPEVRVRHYRPASQSGVLPCLYWIHGSGHVLGQVDQDDLVMDHIVDTVGGAVVSVDWRRAPEHPFPAPMDDCYAGLAWTHRHAAELNVDPERIAVGGASSGGGSAAGLVLLARDRGEFPVCFQLLIYPMLDDRNVTPASVTLTDRRVWNRASNLIGWRAYVGDLDLFIDEDIEYGQRLQQAGVPTELHVYPGGSHAFESYASASALARRFVRDRTKLWCGRSGCDISRPRIAGLLTMTVYCGCGTLHKRGVFDKSHNRPASSTRRLVIEATYQFGPTGQDANGRSADDGRRPRPRPPAGHRRPCTGPGSHLRPLDECQVVEGR